MTDQAMRAFLDSCGTTGPFLLGVEEPGASGPSWRVLDQPFAVVGRDPGSDLVLPDRGVSRHHAYLQMIAGRLFCVDLRSRTGTHWGDEPGVWGWVHPGPGVGIGPFRVRARDGSPDPVPVVEDETTLPLPISRSFRQPELPEATLEILGRTGGPTTWRASRALILLGSSLSCKVRLEGGGVAEIHASLVRTPAGVFAVDLLGPGGILVNGERVRSARLADGDELAIGTHTIRVRCGHAAPAGPGEIAGPSDRRRSIAGAVATPGGGSGLWSALSTGGTDAESFVRAMIDEFGQVQERTAERFQATVMAVLQSFTEIHREQVDLIREEMAQIRELTKEQEALRAGVEGRARSAGGVPALRLVSGETRAAAGGLSPGGATPTRPVAPPRKRAIEPDAERPRPIAERPAPVEDAPRPRPAGLQDEGEFHARVFDRLATIQGERRGRWQKLMESLLGIGP